MKHTACCELKTRTGFTVGVLTFTDFYLKYLMAKSMVGINRRFGGSFKMKKLTFRRAVYYRVMRSLGKIETMVVTK